MTAYLYFEPTARPLTASGAIMPGAYMQFYAAGTTTPSDVYSDADLTTPLSNPVVADSDGRFPPIYLDPSVRYRVQLYDADNVLQYDVDPYLPARDYPPGTILMFFGTEDELEAAYPPSLWQVCDGNNGTPDLRDRVPMGVSSTLSPGDTGGGSGTVNTSTAGAHSHGSSTGSHALTTQQIPPHHHTLLGSTGSGITDTAISASNARGIGAVRNASSGPYVDASDLGDEWVGDTGGGEAHSHTISSDGDHIHTVDVVPPFVAVWFIMRKAT